jgi:hypothetical protein
MSPSKVPSDPALTTDPVMQQNEATEENAKLWSEEAVRRDKEWDADPTSGRPARDVLRDAFAKLK